MVETLEKPDGASKPGPIILVVEDNDDLREVLKTQLEFHNFSPVCVADGIQAFDWLAQNRPALVVLDLMMPRMNGWEVCKRIREKYSPSQLPILMLSALGDRAEDRVRGLAVGANDFLAKPYNLEELIARIRVLLSVKDEKERIEDTLSRYSAPAVRPETQLNPNLLTRKEVRHAEQIVGSDPQMANYVLLEPFAEGGQGTLWSAWDTNHKRVVAMKLMAFDTNRPADLSSFFRETQRPEVFQHPNILPVYEYGTTGNYAYLLGPYLPSRSLDILLANSSLSATEVLAIATQIASALDHLHAYNIIHRDLKPSNILVDGQKRVYVTDFGLAKELGPTTRVLHTGHGTYHYAPPEQHTRSPVSRGADIYSLGIMIYELLTGRLPWGGETNLGIQQLKNPAVELPDPRDEKPALPKTLARALRMLTASDPADRPATASAAIGLIAEALQHDPGEKSRAANSTDTTNGTAATSYKLQSLSDYRMWAAEEASHLLKRVIGAEHSGQNQKTLTDYRFIDSVYSQPDLTEVHIDDTICQRMLQMALYYGYHLEYWWQAVADPQTRWELCEQTILQKPTATPHVIERMLMEPSLVFERARLSSAMVSHLVNLAHMAADMEFCANVLEVIERSTKAETRWQLVGFGLEDDDRLVDLALTDGPQAQLAARLIGLIRSETAVNALLGRTEDGDLTQPSLNALFEVCRIAGNLPSSTLPTIRFRILVELVRKQLLMEPAVLIRAYLVASAGSALGLGLNTYLIYRVPGYLDSGRILNAVGTGSLFGLLIGLGIFTTLLIAGRLRLVPLFPRIALAAAAGTLITIVAIDSFHTLFMGVRPEGWLVPMAACFIALGFAIGGGLIRSRLMRGLLSSVTAAAGIGLSWQLHLISNLTPVIYYGTGSPLQTVFLIAMTAITLGSAAHLVDLTVPLERDTAHGRG